MTPQPKAARAFRQGQIQALLWAGFTTAPEIAAQLGISDVTVRFHLKRMGATCAVRTEDKARGVWYEWRVAA